MLFLIIGSILQSEEQRPPSEVFHNLNLHKTVMRDEGGTEK